MVPISRKEYLRKVEGSKAKKAEVKASIQAAVKDKKKGVTCIICDKPIWADWSRYDGSKHVFYLYDR